jgi:hypothetical protein
MRLIQQSQKTTGVRSEVGFGETVHQSPPSPFLGRLRTMPRSRGIPPRQAFIVTNPDERVGAVSGADSNVQTGAQNPVLFSFCN